MDVDYFRSFIEFLDWIFQKLLGFSHLTSVPASVSQLATGPVHRERERETEERGKSSTGSGWVLEEHDALEKDTLQREGEVGFRLHFVKKVIDWFLNLKKKKKSEEKRKR